MRSGIPELSRFLALSSEDRGYLVAYWRAKDKMTAWEQQEQEDEIRAQTAAANAKR